MKRFLYLHCGFEPPTEAIMARWKAWFESIAERQVDQGGFAGGKEIDHDGVHDLPWGETSITGYNIIEAETMDEAVELASSNPFIRAIRIYELR